MKHLRRIQIGLDGHPGVSILIYFMLLGGFAGSERSGFLGGLLGVAVMFLLFGWMVIGSA